MTKMILVAALTNDRQLYKARYSYLTITAVELYYLNTHTHTHMHARTHAHTHTHTHAGGMERMVVFDGGKPAVTAMLPSLDNFSCSLHSYNFPRRWSNCSGSFKSKHNLCVQVCSVFIDTLKVVPAETGTCRNNICAVKI